MSSSALPPLAGLSPAGSRDDRDEQRNQKVKSLPLMLSSRAPLVQAASSSFTTSSPGYAAPRGRHGTSPPSSQQQQHLPPATVSAVMAAVDPPGSPGRSISPANAQRGSASTKFTRIRGFQGSQPQQPVLGLEGSGLLQTGPGQGQGSQALGGRLGPPGTQQPPGLSDGGSPRPQQLQPTWDGGEGSPRLTSSSPQRLTAGGRLASGGGGSGGGGGSSDAASDVKLQSNRGGNGGGGGSGPGWAVRRGMHVGERGSAGGPTQLPSRGRDVSAFEGPMAGLILGPNGAPVTLAAVGTTPLAIRAASSTTVPRHIAALPGPLSTGGDRPDSAPSQPNELLPPPLDPLAATFPYTRGQPHNVNHQLVPPAAINPPLQLPAAWPAPDSSAAAGLLFPPPYSLPDDSGQLGGSTDAAGPSAVEMSPPHPQLTASASTPSQPSATQLLQRLFRTNRTPPSQTESLQNLLSGGSAGGGAGGSSAALQSGTPSGALSSAPASSVNPLAPMSFSLPAPAATTQPSFLSMNKSSGGDGGGVGVASTSSVSGPTVMTRPATNATFASGASPPGTLLHRPRGRGAAAGTLADLSAALQKSISAGMGEWDLRADGTWGHPDIQQRLLKGALSPEALKNRYRMEERDIISLYRLLYSYSVGFFTDVESLLDVAIADRTSSAFLGLAVGTNLRKELLENVFRAYATLWDEALMIVFDSEMTSMLADKNAALRALDRGAVEVEGLKREKVELAARLEEFVKQNVDNVLASRHLQQAATRLEGEVHSLHNANEQLVTNMARHAVEVANLERQLDSARLATVAAEGRAEAAEAHLLDLKAIVSDQNSTLSAQFFQIKEMEQKCAELQESVRNLNRRRAAVLGLLTGNTPDPSDAGLAAAAASGTSQPPTDVATSSHSPLTTAVSSPPSPPSPALARSSSRVLATTGGTTSSPGSARVAPVTGDGGGSGGAVAPPGTPPAASGSTTVMLPPLDNTAEGVLADMSLLDPEELGRLLSDKTRAFNLMHADFVVKMHELDEQRSVNDVLRDEIESMKAEVQRSEEEAAASDRTADKFRAKYESGRMTMEDLEEKNRKLIHKNAELVRSYWPLMTRLKEAEEEAARCREQAARDREQAEADRVEADVLRAEAEDTRAALRELEERRAEANSHELELPSDVLALLPEAQVLALRRFTRSCHRRVAHLNSQVVALVDQVTQLRLKEILQREHQVMYGTGEPPSLVDGGDGATPASGSALAAAVAEAMKLRAAVTNRDKWLEVLVKAMTELMAQMENIMARDWETTRTLRLEQKRRKQHAKREARRARDAAAATGGGSTGGSGDIGGGGGGGDGTIIPSVSGGMESESMTSLSLSTMPSAMQVANANANSNQAAPSYLPGEVSGSGISGGGPSIESSTAALQNTGCGNSTSPAVSPFFNSNREAGDAATAVESLEDPSAASLVSQQPSGGGGSGDDNANGAEDDVAEEMEGNDDAPGGDDALSVAAGRLSQLVGVSNNADGVEHSSNLVALDRAYERLMDSAERLMEWSQALLKRKEQTANFGQVRQKLETVTRQLDTTSLELNTLKPVAEALRNSVRGYEVMVKDMTLSTASYKQRANTAESRLESVETQLAVVTAQLREIRDAQKLLEEEYWKAKDVALDAEVTTGELKAGRMKALEAAAKALSAVSGLEKEARENRDQRMALEADLVGYKAWVRHMEAGERKQRQTLKELADAVCGCEERDRQLGELKERITTLEQQLRFKSLEASSLDSRVKVLSGELVEERRAARIAVAAARGSSAVQMDTAIRQAGAAEAEALARGERVAVLEGRLVAVTRELDEAQAATTAAQARLVPLTHELDRLRAHFKASKPLLQTMNRAAESIDRRLTLLENAAATTPPMVSAAVAAAAAGDSGAATKEQPLHVRFGVPVGSLELAMEALLGKLDEALDGFAAVAAEAAGDETPVVLAALEGLVGQLLSTLSKGGKEPIQSVAVLKAQLARDDRELAAARATLLDVRIAGEEDARDAVEQRSVAAAATKAAAAATAAAVRDGRRAAAAESALMAARRDLDSVELQLSEARLSMESAKRHAERSQKRVVELEADLASAHSQRRHYEAEAEAAKAMCVELKRRGDALEEEALRDYDAAREARERAAAVEATAAAAELHCSELEAALETERREVLRQRADVAAAVAASEELRNQAVMAEQRMLETQAKFADMIRHDESIEERLRQAQFEAENMRKKADEAITEAAEVNAQYEALQQRAWQLQVALQTKHGEKEEVLRELVEVTHGAAARVGAVKAVGSASVKQRADGTHEISSSFKAKRTEDT